MKSILPSATQLRNLSAIALGSVYLLHFFHVLTTAVNVPHRDEWQILTKALLEPQRYVEWLLTPHNEHFILSTKLIVLSLYNLNAWNVSLHLIFNFMLYGALLLVVLQILRRNVPKRDHWLAYLSLIFPLSSLNWENHLWAFQTSIHSYLLLTSLSCYLIINPKSRLRFLLGILAALLAPFCFSAGYPSTLCIAAVLLFRGLTTEDRTERRVQVFASIVLFALIASLLFTHLEQARLVSRVSFLWPTELRFWEFFFNSVSLGFGVETYSVAVGVLATSLCCLGMLFAIAKRSSNSPALLLLLTLFASLLSIAGGRGNESAIEIWSKSSRYYEIAAFVVPLSVGLLAAHARGWLKTFSLLLIFSIGVIGHHNNFEFSHYYWVAEQKRNGRACAKDVLLNNQEKDCGSIWGMGTRAELERTKKLSLSYLSN